MRVLIVTENNATSDALSTLLTTQNISAQQTSVSESYVDATDLSFSLIIADYEAINHQAEESVQQLRKASKRTPIIVLGDGIEVPEQIKLLDLGADEVLVKPLDDELLMAHVRTLIRRCEPSASAVLKYEDLQLDLRSLELRRAGKSIPCTSRELAIMEFLLRNPQRIVSRQELVEAIWDSSVQPESNVIEVFIARLRRKLDKPFPTRLIHTLVSRGYMLSITRPGMESTAQQFAPEND
jgi:DNA-binding response OmpR family regulator